MPADPDTATSSHKAAVRWGPNAETLEAPPGSASIPIAVEAPRPSTALLGTVDHPLAAELAGLSDRYEVVRKIGAGGMGVVYEARDRALDRPVAIKVLRTHGAVTDEQIERLEREARTAARLGHPNIVAVTDFARAPGHGAFLVMELLAGESLAARLGSKGRLAPAEVIDIALQVLDALSVAHRAGVVHRDLKPENIHLVPLANGARLAKLLDFGIVKLRETSSSKRLTETGSLIGTPLYMAPEQIEMSEVDARTDVYAMGATMYQMLSGMPPYAGNTPGAILGAIFEGPPVPLSVRMPDLDRRLLALVERAMARAPADRFHDAGAMRDALLAADPRPSTTLSGPADKLLGKMVAWETPTRPATKPTQRESNDTPPVGASTVQARGRRVAPIGRAPSTRSSRPVWIVGAIVVVALVVVSAALVVHFREGRAPLTGVDPPASAGVAPTTAAQPPEPVAATPPATAPATTPPATSPVPLPTGAIPTAPAPSTEPAPARPRPTTRPRPPVTARPPASPEAEPTPVAAPPVMAPPASDRIQDGFINPFE